MDGYTEATRIALASLRSGANFQWYLIPMLAFVIYVYSAEAEKKNYSAILAGLGFYGLEFFIEMLNGLFLHFSQRSAVWTAPADSAFLITVGLNIEISMMFAVAGIVFVKQLPADRNSKIFGLPNRPVMAIGNAIFCVAVEVVLNAWGALVWEYPWWNFPNVWLIVAIGYAPYMFFSFWIYDMESRKKQITVVAIMWAISISGYALFMGVLGWI
jgi:hypothetical protein